MDSKEKIYIQKQYYQINSVLYIITALLCGKAIFKQLDVTYHFIAIIFIGLLFLAETGFYIMKNKEVNQQRYLTITGQLVRIFLAFYVYFVLGHDIGYEVGSALFVVFSIEIILTMGNADVFSRVVCCVALICPLLAIVVLMSLGKMSYEFSFYDRLSNCILISAIVIVFSQIISFYVGFYEEKLFSQCRLVDRANEANQQLTEQQIKIEKTNELLGLQKNQLKNANTRINVAHAEMVVQNEVANAIAESLEKEDLIRKVSILLFNRLDIDLVSVILQDKTYAVCSRLGTSFDQQLGEDITKGRLSKYVKNHKTYVDNFIEADKYADNQIKELGSVMIIPIMDAKKCMGVLLVGQKKPDYFVDNRTFFETLAGQLIIGIKNTSLYAQMKDMAIRDGLTGIFNRRHLTEVLNRLLGEAMKNRTSISLVLFDIDKFKLVNDTYGHLMGDEVIKAIAHLLDDVAKKFNGLAGRYGGEEFVLVFPDKAIDETIVIVKELQDKVRKMTVQNGDESVSVRVSGGLACYPETCKNPSELLNRADWSMYHSKKNGRDQITVDSELITTDME